MKVLGILCLFKPAEHKNNFLRTCHFDGKQKHNSIDSNVQNKPSLGNWEQEERKNRTLNNNHEMNIPLPSFQEAVT